MKVVENHYNGDWRDKVLNSFPLLLDTDSIDSVAVAWDEQGVYCPEDYSLFYNGYVMVRLTFPFGIFLHIKPVRNARFQCGLGWKLNGRFGLIFRWQTDANAARGISGPNVGQANGWSRGTA